MIPRIKTEKEFESLAGLQAATPKPVNNINRALPLFPSSFLNNQMARSKDKVDYFNMNRRSIPNNTAVNISESSI